MLLSFHGELGTGIIEGERVRGNPKICFDNITMPSVSSGKSTTDDLDSIQEVFCVPVEQP